MFSDMDEMYFTNPSEADSIIDEATNSLRDLIKDDVKCVIDAYNKALREKDNLESDIARLNWEKQHIEEDIEVAKRDAENAKTNQIPETYINNFVKKYTGSYVPGDEVYVANHSYKSSKCPTCNGSGKVEASINGKSTIITCPKCNGYKNDSHCYYFVKKDVIETVDLKLRFDKNHVTAMQTRFSDLEPTYVYLQDCGGLSDVSLIFRTEAEAQAKADELNKKEAEQTDG